MDPNREKSSKAKKKRKPGGQPGHEGNTLQPVDNPDEIKEIKIDRKTLPGGTACE
jgi:transposase